MDGESRSPPARSAPRPSSSVRASGGRTHCSIWVVEPVADLPGVGVGLVDHPVTRLLLVPKPGSCDRETPLAQVVVRYTAPGSDEFNDMQQVMFSHVDVASLGGEQAVDMVGTPLAIGLPVALERPLSRGRLSLSSADPRVQPSIEARFHGRT